MMKGKAGVTKPPRRQTPNILQTQILRESAGVAEGSRSSVVRASTAKVGGLGSSGYPCLHYPEPVAVLTTSI